MSGHTAGTAREIVQRMEPMYLRVRDPFYWDQIDRAIRRARGLCEDCGERKPSAREARCRRCIRWRAN